MVEKDLKDDKEFQDLPLEEQDDVNEIIEEAKKVRAELKASGFDKAFEDTTSGINNSSTTEEAVAKSTDKLSDDASRNMKLFTELSPKQIALEAKLLTRAQEFYRNEDGTYQKDNPLQNFIDDLNRLMVSKQRKGRNELVKVAGAAREEERKRNILTRLVSRAKGES